MNAVQAIAAGVQALPGTGRAFAATQAAWRFFANPRVTLSKLVAPLRDVGRQACGESAASHMLLVHDWSKLDYDGHKSKKDLTQLSQKLDRGYELTGLLLVDGHGGLPLAPMGISVLSGEGMHTTEAEVVQPRTPHLEQVLPWMDASRSWGLRKPCVHVIDREADSLKHLSEIVRTLGDEGAFVKHGEVSIRAKKGRKWVAETEIVLDGPAWGTTPEGKTCRVPGPPDCVVVLRQ